SCSRSGSATGELCHRHRCCDEASPYSDCAEPTLRGRLKSKYCTRRRAHIHANMTSPRIDRTRLVGRLETFNRIGALPGGGNCRLALSDEDRAGRDLLVQWMRELGLAVTIDAIGNIFGLRRGREEDAPVMFGSHVDTVGTGGRYDGLYG